MRTNGVEEAEALVRYHLVSSAAALSVVAEKVAGAPESITSEEISAIADAVGTRLRRAAELMRVFER